MTSEDPSSDPTEFILTREHRRFAEFCDACRQARYIGLCYGVPGVGKTVSARQYSRWNQVESLMGGPPPYRHRATPPRNSGPWRTVLFTPGVTNTPRTVEHAVSNLWGTVDGLGARATWYGDPDTVVARQSPDLLVVDEADRLKTASLEQLRDFYDRRHVGVVLIGMPGLQKRLARYAQLYSRVGFVHQFQPLSGRELQNVIEQQWVQLELDTGSHEPPTDAAVVNAIARVTGGNFRLVNRLLAEIERVLAVNRLSTVTTEVVAFARESLVIGPT
jgi:DNA transposition AAA+ family ATPase